MLCNLCYGKTHAVELNNGNNAEFILEVRELYSNLLPKSHFLSTK